MLFLPHKTQNNIFITLNFKRTNFRTMEKKDLIILVLSLALAGFSLYRKYVAKKGGKVPGKPANELDSAVRNDDYEPYSGK